MAHDEEALKKEADRISGLTPLAAVVGQQEQRFKPASPETDRCVPKQSFASNHEYIHRRVLQRYLGELINQCEQLIQAMGESRELSTARTKLQEARMWAEQHRYYS